MIFLFLKVKPHLPPSCPHLQCSTQAPSHFSSPASPPLPRWPSRLQVCPSAQHSHHSALLSPPKRTLTSCLPEKTALWRDPHLSLCRAPGFQLVQVLRMSDSQPQPSRLPRSIPVFPLAPEVLQSPRLRLSHTPTSTSLLPLAIPPCCLGHHRASLFITLTSYLDLTTSHQGKWTFFFLAPSKYIRPMNFYLWRHFFCTEKGTFSIVLRI